MSDLREYTPVALYARVSSDKQDVDLSVAAQLRAPREYAAKNGYIVARYALPLPQDAPSSGLDAENVSIPRPVLFTANCG